jgi:hypothetical protein
MSRNTIIVEIDMSDIGRHKVSSTDKGDQVWTLADIIIGKIRTLTKQKGKKTYSPIVWKLCRVIFFKERNHDVEYVHLPIKRTSIKDTNQLGSRF